MTNFTTSKDWVFSTNRIPGYDPKSVFLEFKRFFSDFYSSGFEIVASCNGTTSGPGDLINSVADVNNTGAIYPTWFVVRNNNHQNSIEILFEYLDTFNTMFANVRYSNVGWSNFVNVSEPYAPDNNGSSTGDLIYNLDDNNDPDRRPIFHFARSVDGKCSRIYVNQNHRLSVAYFWDEINFSNSTIPISYFTRILAPDHDELYSFRGIRGISEETAIDFSGSYTENTTRQKLTFYADFGGSINAASNIWDVGFDNDGINTMSNLWDCSAAWVGEISTSVGEISKVPDLWFAARDDTDPASPAASGSMVCGATLTQGDNDYACIGAGLVVPWDGSVPRVDFSSTLPKPKVAAFDYTAFDEQEADFIREPFEAVEFNTYRIVINEPNLESSGSVDRQRLQVRYPYNRGRRKGRGAKFTEG